MYIYDMYIHTCTYTCTCVYVGGVYVYTHSRYMWRTIRWVRPTAHSLCCFHSKTRHLRQCVVAIRKEVIHP